MHGVLQDQAPCEIPVAIEPTPGAWWLASAAKATVPHGGSDHLSVPGKDDRVTSDLLEGPVLKGVAVPLVEAVGEYNAIKAVVNVRAQEMVASRGSVDEVNPRATHDIQHLNILHE